jgi:predicted dehydrogenase
MRAEENPAGSLGVVGVNKIDLARYLTGGEVARVFAHLPTTLQQRPDLGDISRLEAGRWMREQGTQLPANVTMAPVTASDFGTLHAKLSTGALLSVSAAQSSFTRPGPTPDYQVHGTLASAFVFFDASNRRGGKLLLVRGAERDTEEVPLRVFKDARTHNAHIFTTYVLPGLQARAEGRPHATASFYDGWKAAEVIDAALTSHASGAWVDLPEAQPAPA